MNRLRLAVLLLSVACAGELKSGDPSSASTPATLSSADAPTAAPTGEVALSTQDDETLYALGVSVGQSLDLFALSPEEAKRVIAGFEDALAGRKPRVDMAVCEPRIQGIAEQRAMAAASVAREKAGAFLEQLAGSPGATKMPSGLVYLETQPGTGRSPTAADTVTVHYRGTLADGKEFDSSYARNEPAQFPLGGVIPCWTEGVQKMKIGGKSKLGCPAQLAYGDQGVPGIPGGSALLFEVELISIQ